MTSHVAHVTASHVAHVSGRSVAANEIDLPLQSLLNFLLLCTLGAPPKFMSNYIMIKHALLGLVKSIASEYGGKGIRANAISPGMIETKFLSNIDPRQVEMSAASSPLKRHITLDEVAAAIDYLFSEEAACCNGINLNLSGGIQG